MNRRRRFGVLVALAIAAGCGGVAMPAMPDGAGDPRSGADVAEMQEVVDPGMADGQDDAGADLEDAETGPEAIQCTADEDCKGRAVSAACHMWTCDKASGSCIERAVDGGTCNDGDDCTTDERCIAGVCQGGAVDCDDHDPCTKDSCSKSGGCAHTSAPGAPCEDGNACTLKDRCNEKGACIGGAYVLCNDGNPCTEDKCLPDGSCRSDPVDGECSDLNACTVGDRCVDGKCVGGTGAPDCDDGDACTEDQCDPVEGCIHHVLSGCLPCLTDADCPAAGGCWVVSCDPTVHTCVSQPADGRPCTDSNPCTDNDECESGKCKPGTLKSCDDGSPCTSDKCNTMTGYCEHAPQPGPCDDQSPCTTGDTCSKGGECVGTPVDCDDVNPCTADTCDLASGQCVHQAVGGSCDDGDPCTVADTCQASQCIGQVVSCDDGNWCTMDACDRVLAKCVHTILSSGCSDCTTDGDCNDQNECTVDSCVNLACQFLAAADGTGCEDGNPCTAGDGCVGTVCKGGGATSCDDGNVCTDDNCVPGEGGCVHSFNQAPCSDGDSCTLGDHCVNGGCVPGAVCDDGNPCTVDNCVPWTQVCAIIDPGPLASPLPSGLGGGGSQMQCCHLPRFCDDANPCTNDFCDPVTGYCGTTPNQDLCKASQCQISGSGPAYVVASYCSDGTCPAQPAAVSCDDGMACTVDWCDVQLGCQHQSTCTDPNPVCGKTATGAAGCMCRMTGGATATCDAAMANHCDSALGCRCNGTPACDPTLASLCDATMGCRCKLSAPCTSTNVDHCDPVEGCMCGDSPPCSGIKPVCCQDLGLPHCTSKAMCYL